MKKIFNNLRVTEGQLQLIKVWVSPLGKPIRLSWRRKMQICKAWKCFLAEQLRCYGWLNTEYIFSDMWDCVAQWQETFSVQTYVQTITAKPLQCMWEFPHPDFNPFPAGQYGMKSNLKFKKQTNKNKQKKKHAPPKKVRRTLFFPKLFFFLFRLPNQAS